MSKLKTFLAGLLLVTLFIGNATVSYAIDKTAPSVLQVKKAVANPNGNFDELYVLDGDVSPAGIKLDQSLVKLPEASGIQAGKSKEVHLFHINDMHGNIVKYNAAVNTYVVSKMKKIIDNAKKAADKDCAFVFVSAGDDHIGTPFDELLGSNPETFKNSAPYVAYSAAGLDLSIVGNHETDKKSEIFSLAVTQDAKFPVLTANVINSSFDFPTYPAAIGVTNGLRIGFIGLTNTMNAYYRTAVDPTIEPIDPTTAVKNVVGAIDNYCDMIVVVSHLGYNGSSRHTIEVGDFNIAEILNEVTDKPAVVVGGHTHTTTNKENLEADNIVGRVPVVQAGENGGYIGEVSVKLSKDKTGKIDGKFDAKLHAIKPATSRVEGAVLQKEEDYDNELNAKIAAMKADLDVKLKESIAKVEAGNPDITDEVTIIDRYIGESAVANFLNEAIVARSAQFPTGKVDFTMVNSTGLRGFEPGSDLTYEGWYKVMPYADSILVAEFTGQEIKDMIDNNAMRFFKKSELKPYGGELDPSTFLERGMIHFSKGIEYEVVFGQTADQNKAVNIKINGQPIEKVLNNKYKFAVVSYLSNGNGYWNGQKIGNGLPDSVVGYNLKALCAERATDTGLSYRLELMEYIKSVGTIGKKTGAAKDGRLKVTQK